MRRGEAPSVVPRSGRERRPHVWTCGAPVQQGAAVRGRCRVSSGASFHLHSQPLTFLGSLGTWPGPRAPAHGTGPDGRLPAAVLAGSTLAPHRAGAHMAAPLWEGGQRRALAVRCVAALACGTGPLPRLSLGPHHPRVPGRTLKHRPFCVPTRAQNQSLPKGREFLGKRVRGCWGGEFGWLIQASRAVGSISRVGAGNFSGPGGGGRARVLE